MSTTAATTAPSIAEVADAHQLADEALNNLAAAHALAAAAIGRLTGLERRLDHALHDADGTTPTWRVAEMVAHRGLVARTVDALTVATHA